MLRLIAALVIVTVFGSFLRWLWRRWPERSWQERPTPPGLSGLQAARWKLRRFFASAVEAMLIGMAVVVLLFVLKIIGQEVLQPAGSGKASSSQAVGTQHCVRTVSLNRT